MLTIIFSVPQLYFSQCQEPDAMSTDAGTSLLSTTHLSHPMMSHYTSWQRDKDHKIITQKLKLHILGNVSKRNETSLKSFLLRDGNQIQNFIYIGQVFYHLTISSEQKNFFSFFGTGSWTKALDQWATPPALFLYFI